MRVYLQRKLGRSAVFISVLEFQRNGNPHLHILIDSYLPKEWLLRSWQALGGGYTDIRFVDLHRVAAYLSKYMAKEWLDDFPEKCRRITASRGIVLFGRSSTKRGWVLFRQSITWFRETARMRQLVVADEGHTEEDGARQLVRFVADGWIEWRQPRFMRTNQWREEDYLVRTGRRTISPGVRFSPATAEVELLPSRITQL